jgi:predicted PurR-regulated permease PerM
VSAPTTPAPSSGGALSTRAILRSVLVVVCVVLALYLIFLLRRPLTWIFIAGFLAIALAGPVRLLSRHMKRGFAVALVYIALIVAPFVLLAVLLPPIVTQGNNLVNNLPRYASDVSDFVAGNGTLRRLQEDYDITGKLEQQAEKLPGP